MPSRLHEALIEHTMQEQLVGHVSRAATAIEGREKPTPKPKQPAKPKRKRGRPRKGEERPKEPSRLQRQQQMTLAEMLDDLPQACDVGCIYEFMYSAIYMMSRIASVQTTDNRHVQTSNRPDLSSWTGEVKLPIRETDGTLVPIIPEAAVVGPLPAALYPPTFVAAARDRPACGSFAPDVDPWSGGRLPPARLLELGNAGPVRGELARAAAPERPPILPASRAHYGADAVGAIAAHHQTRRVICYPSPTNRQCIGAHSSSAGTAGAQRQPPPGPSTTTKDGF